MQKITKGALAAAGAGALLLGGVGSLAYWTDTTTADGTNFAVGEVKIASQTCTTAPWKIDGGATFTAGSKLVPGDTLTKTCSLTVSVKGDHVTATVGATGGVFTKSVALGSEITPTVAYTKTPSGGSSASITPSSPVALADGDVIGVTMTLAWARGVENNTSNVLNSTLTGAISDVVFTLTQDHAVPTP